MGLCAYDCHSNCFLCQSTLELRNQNSTPYASSALFILEPTTAFHIIVAGVVECDFMYSPVSTGEFALRSSILASVALFIATAALDKSFLDAHFNDAAKALVRAIYSLYS